MSQRVEQPPQNVMFETSTVLYEFLAATDFLFDFPRKIFSFRWRDFLPKLEKENSGRQLFMFFGEVEVKVFVCF